MLFIEIQTLEYDSPVMILIIGYYRDRNTRIRFPGGHFEIMLFKEIEKIRIQFPGGNFEIMLLIEIEKLEFDSPAAILKLNYLQNRRVRFHSGSFLFLKIAKKKIRLPGGHIEIRLFRDIETLEFDFPGAILK